MLGQGLWECAVIGGPKENVVSVLLAIIVVAILVVLVGPVLTPSRSRPRPSRSNANLSSIYEGMVKYSLSNNERFPGLDASGGIVRAGDITLSDQDGDVPRARLALLIHAGYIDPWHAISPFDMRAERYELGSAAGSVENKHLSYAMQRLTPVALDKPLEGRTASWSRSTNPRAIIMSDRNTGSDATKHVSSLHTHKNKGQWHGSVCWGDGNVRFERTSVFSTAFPGPAPDGNAVVAADDNIFVDDFAGTPKEGNDAMMVYQDNRSGVSQD